MTAPFSLAALTELWRDLFAQVREGAILSDAAGGVLAANRAAGHQLGRTSFAGVGLDELFAGPYLARARGHVQQASGRTIDFLCPGRDGGHLFDCRLCWYADPPVASPYYLLTFSEALAAGNSRLAAAGRCASIVKLRGPLANLKAAAENLLAYPEMSPVMRSAFENVIAQESVSLTQTFTALADLCREMPAGRCKPEPSDGAALVGRMLALRGSSPGLPRLVEGDPHNVLVDARWLQQLLLSLCDFLLENHVTLAEIQFSPETTGRFIYLDLLWEGQPLHAAAIEEWRRRPLSQVVGSPSGADILRGHGSDLWSQGAEKAGLALVRLPLPLAAPGGRGDG
jgi:DNA polymerase-3 subunit epsilon